MNEFLSRNITLKEFNKFSNEGIEIVFTNLSTTDCGRYSIKLPNGYGLSENYINEIKEIAKNFTLGGLYNSTNANILLKIENLINDKIIPMEYPKDILI